MPTDKTPPFDKAQLEAICKEFPTPFHLYDEKGMVENAQALNQAFSWNEGFREYYAVKAAPNPYILKILGNLGLGGDCSSKAELMLCDKVDIRGERIMFTSNATPADEYAMAKELGGIINLDDISHIAYLEEHVGLPELICFRYNPGPARTGNVIIGDPKEAKYGFTKEQLVEGYKLCRDKGVKRFGLHAMVASNELDPTFFVETANMLFDLVIEISSELGIDFEFVNLGGGIGIPYRPEETAIDYNDISVGVKKAYEEKIVPAGQAPLKIYLECGRVITGPYGYLVSRVLHKKSIYKEYVGLDACMANLMRPGMYDAYHHITVMGKENATHDHTYDVTGSLCENNDKFAIDRKLPEIEIGDLVVIQDSGAHGHSMGFNYNGKLRSAEVLLRKDGRAELIRRAETYEDHFATLDFEGLGSFKA